jgi:CRISPR-associated protein Csc3
VLLVKSLLDESDPGDQVTCSFIEQLLPSLLLRFTGMVVEGEDDGRLNGTGRQSPGSGAQQDLIGWLHRRIFPTMRLLRLMEVEQIGGDACPSDTERRIFVLAVVARAGSEGGAAAQAGLAESGPAAREWATAALGELLRQCQAEEFFADFEDYLEEIAFLACRESALDPADWRFRLPLPRLALLQRCFTYANLLAQYASSPRAVQSAQQAGALPAALATLSGGQLEFCYHQLREVRGLLSGAINGGMHRLLTEWGGVWPYLFFPHGTVYLKRSSQEVHPSSEAIAEAVRAELRDLCAERIRVDAAGLKFSNQARVKHPDYYYEFLSMEEYGELLARCTVLRTRNDISARPLETLRQMLASGEIDADLPVDFTPDLRIGMLARFFSVVFTHVLGKLLGKQADLREVAEQAVVSHLGLDPYWERSESIPNRGGFNYRWFWLGACYLHDHPAIVVGEEQGESLAQLFRSTFQLVCQVAGDELSEQMPRRYLGHLPAYLDGVVELSPVLGGNPGTLPDFYAELERYCRSKGKGEKLMCTVCNGAFPTWEQKDSSVLFQPWVYKNKLPLYAPKNAGGICVICALEQMLRMVLQQGLFRRTGKSFEALKTKYFTLYPDSFFTVETAALAQSVIDRLQLINFFAIRRQLGERLLSSTDLLALESVTAPHQEVELVEEEAELSEEEAAVSDGEEGEDGAQPAKLAPADWRYLKFRQGRHPGVLFFGMHAGTKDDEAASWAMPAFLALLLPLVTHTRLVLSESPLPQYSSANEFSETVVFDAPYSYIDRILKGGRISGGQVLTRLQLLTSIYLVTMDVHARAQKPGWDRLPEVARQLETEPTVLFSYLRKQQRGDFIYWGDAQRYLHTYELMEGDMSRITKTVENYVTFYRGGINSHSILRPVDIISEAIINSPVDVDSEDLQLEIQGQIRSMLDRARNRQTSQSSGYALLWGKAKLEQEPALVEKFVRDFYREVFLDYCNGERSLLRHNIRAFRDGCEVHYRRLRVQWQREREQEGAVKEEAVADAASE